MDNHPITDQEIAAMAEAWDKEQPTKDEAQVPASDEQIELPTKADQETEGEDQATKPEQSKESELDSEDEEEVTGADDDDLTIPELDASITDPRAKQRWAEQWKGLQKQKTKAKELEAELKTREQQIAGLQQIGESLANPATYKQAFKHLVQAIADEHKVSVGELIGTEQATVDDPEFDDTDRKLLARAKELAVKELETKYGVTLEQVQRQTQANKEESEFNQRVKDTLPRLRDKVAKTTDGFQISESMLATALKNHPSIDPYKAVLTEFVEQIIVHRTTGKPTKKAPEVQRSQEVQPKKVDLTRGYEKDWEAAIGDLASQL